MPAPLELPEATIQQINESDINFNSLLSCHLFIVIEAVDHMIKSFNDGFCLQKKPSQ